MLPKVEEIKTIPDEILKKLQDNTMNISMYLLKRDEYLQFLNQLLEINFSPSFNKLLKRMLKLASIKQNNNCRKFKAMHKKLLRIHKNSLLESNQVMYRCNGASLGEQENLKFPFVDCILDINTSGKAGQI